MRDRNRYTASAMAWIVALTACATVSGTQPATAQGLNLVAFLPDGVAAGITEPIDGISAMARGGAVEYWDLTDALAPLRIGAVTLDGLAVAVARDDARTYALTKSGLVQSIDSTDPSSPSTISAVATSLTVGGGGGPQAAALLVGDHLFIANGFECRVVDVSDPADMTEVATFAPAGGQMAHANDVLYTAGFGHLTTIDISTPAVPMQLARVNANGANDIVLSEDGTRAFVAGNGCMVFDVTDPSMPAELGVYEAGVTFATVAYGTHPDPEAERTAGQRFIYLEALQTGEVRKVEVAGAEFTEILIWSPISPDTDPRDAFYYLGQDALVSLHGQLLRILKIAACDVEASAEHDIGGRKEDVEADDDGAWFSRENGVDRIPDEALEWTPRGTYTPPNGESVLDAILGSLVPTRASGARGGAARTLVVGTTTGLRVVDVTDPENPAEIGSVPLNAAARVVEASGPYAYVGAANPGSSFRVVDLSSPTTPVVVATRSTGAVIDDIDIEGNLAFVMPGLHIFDVSDPTNPVELNAVLDISGRAVEVSGTIAYAQGFFGTTDFFLRALDVSDPMNVTELGSYPTFDTISDVEVFDTAARGGARFAVTAGLLGVSLYDVTDPASIQLVDTFQTYDQATSIALHEERIFAAAGDAGVFILELDGVTPVIFDRFDARLHAGAVELEWSVRASEPFAGFTLERRDASGLSVPLGGGLLDAGARAFSDRDVEAGHRYAYVLRAIYTDGSSVVAPAVEVALTPTPARLLRTVPNPFNPRTTLHFELAEAGEAWLGIYDATGRFVAGLAEGRLPAGRHEVVWDGRDASGVELASGVYVVELRSGGDRTRTRVTLLR